MVKHRGHLLLEPSFGAGHLLKKFKEYNDDYPIMCYELDRTVKPVVEFNKHQLVLYGDFTLQRFTRNFKTIIGNPPYVKQTTGNLYIKFIELSYNLLDTDGELIFIVPSDFIKLTSASALITRMIENGSFTDFLFPHNEKLFEGASIDVVAFRYQKGLRTTTTLVNGKPMICNVHNGIITFSESQLTGTPISNLFNVYVGLVTGKEDVYKVDFGNIEVLNDKGKVDTYIFTNTFPTSNQTINAHLLSKKQELLDRKIKKFNESNWFEWGAPRNLTAINSNMGKPCIYVRNVTRSKEVAFIHTVRNFGGGLLCLIPKVAMESKDLERVVSFLNGSGFQKDYIYSGRFKIGHKQVSNAIMPS